jgi:hypothetical protein
MQIAHSILWCAYVGVMTWYIISLLQNVRWCVLSKFVCRYLLYVSENTLKHQASSWLGQINQEAWEDGNIGFSSVRMVHIFFIHATSDRFSGWYHSLTIVNNVTITWKWRYLFHIPIPFLDGYPIMEWLDHIAAPFLNFLRNWHALFPNGYIN